MKEPTEAEKQELGSPWNPTDARHAPGTVWGTEGCPCSRCMNTVAYAKVMSHPHVPIYRAQLLPDQLAVWIEYFGDGPLPSDRWTQESFAYACSLACTPLADDVGQ